MGEGLSKSPMMVLQETVAVSDFAGTDKHREKESLSCKGEICYPSKVARSHQPLVSFPQRVAWAKLFQLEPKFARFMDEMRRTYADIPNNLAQICKIPG